MQGGAAAQSGHATARRAEAPRDVDERAPWHEVCVAFHTTLAMACLPECQRIVQRNVTCTVRPAVAKVCASW